MTLPVNNDAAVSVPSAAPESASQPVDVSSPRRRRWLAPQTWPWAPAAVVAVLIGLWQLSGPTLKPPPYILPTPNIIFMNMFGNWDLYGPAIVATVEAVAIGFAIAVVCSILAAALIVSIPVIDRMISPLMVALQLVPKIAMAPLFVVWFGFGLLPKVLLVVIIAFFPIVVDTVVGLSGLSQQSLALFQSMRATRRQIFWKLRLPRAVPSIMGGLKVGVTLAVIGAVVAEFVGSTAGLGAVLSAAQGNLDTPTIFGSIVWLTLIGWAYYLVVVAIEKLSVRHSAGPKSEK